VGTHRIPLALVFGEDGVSCQVKGVCIMRKWITAAATLVALASMPGFAAEVKIDDLIVANTMQATQRDTELKAAKGFYEFWNTGDESLLKAVISPNFADHTLPPGRPQGPASEHFRAAAPDPTVEIREMAVADDYVTVHMEFKGHFTGAFGKAKGQGQSIDFVATDLLKIADGRVTDNWHIEDNLSLLSQIGVAKIK
jgi:predicted ester cyclase